mgnify:CR=1 FL=1
MGDKWQTRRKAGAQSQGSLVGGRARVPKNYDGHDAGPGQDPGESQSISRCGLRISRNGVFFCGFSVRARTRVPNGRFLPYGSFVP